MISIVDDDEFVREATKGLVRSLGYDAAVFASAEEFLRSNRVHDTACVVTDVKGLVAGAINMVLALLIGASIPSLVPLAAAALLGFIGYGLSLVLFVLALREIGTARTGAYYSTAPFIGAVIAFTVPREPITPALLISSVLMGFGVWLHLTERHEHEHEHERIVHVHPHIHDEHHQHEHGASDPPGEPHSHRHVHVRLRHRHPHYPDAHHEHSH